MDFRNCVKFSCLLCFISACEAAEYDSDTKEAIESSAIAEEQSNSDPTPVVVQSSNSTPISITGFYGGLDLGADVFKSKFNKEKDYAEAGNDANKKKASKKSNTKTGFLGDVFAGYNCQFGRFMFGLECSVGMATSKNNVKVGTAIQNDASVKRKYNFGITPRVGYAIFNSLFAYVNVGSILSKYKINNKVESSAKSTSKHPTRASLSMGLGVEQNFGPLFVRGECNKIFNKNLGTVDGVKTAGSSYVFKIGGGYRF